jgi:hypothetical protein
MNDLRCGFRRGVMPRKNWKFLDKAFETTNWVDIAVLGIICVFTFVHSFTYLHMVYSNYNNIKKKLIVYKSLCCFDFR